jgi:hypothetical protein
MRKHVAVLVVVVIAAAGALAGCGNSESSGTGNTGSSGSGNAGATTGPGDTGSIGGDSEISKLLAKTKNAKYKVTYQSGSDQPFTIAQDPPRFSYVSGDSSTYVLADNSAVSCSGTGSSATCTKLPGTGDSVRQGLSTSFGALAALFLGGSGTGIPGLANIHTTNKQIAGRDAACVTIDSSTLGALSAALKGSYTICIDKNTGIMLQAKSDNGSGSTTDITATNFGSPTNADLTPPATASTAPGQ